MMIESQKHFSIIKFACKLYKQVYEIMIDDDVMVMKVILTFIFEIH